MYGGSLRDASGIGDGDECISEEIDSWVALHCSNMS